MILKEYQKRTLADVRRFVQHLAAWRDKDMEARSQDPEWGFDWVHRAWRKTVPGRLYHARRNGFGERLPAFCLKIPTGGGKTLLATRVIDLVNAHFRQTRRGLVLWIVPTTQIYNQTLRALKDRDHPYRQQLDLSSGRRTLIFEKTTAFGPRDVAENLCVLLLMLPSANRRTRDTLRMFRDSGGFDRFFPPDDDPSAHAGMLEEHPNLDTFEQTAGFWGRYIKTSLGNTVRLLRPLIILDEGHKAYSVNAKKTLEGFNPCMIVELSATPARAANVLVEILGRELNDEEMIKLDLHIHNKSGGDWRDTLLASVEHRERLEAEARRHDAETGTYIRPICAIQVERTGKQQRKHPHHPHEPDVEDGDHTARRTHSAAALRAQDRSAVAGRELRVLLQPPRLRAPGGGQEGVRAGGAAGSRREGGFRWRPGPADGEAGDPAALTVSGGRKRSGAPRLHDSGRCGRLASGPLRGGHPFAGAVGRHRPLGAERPATGRGDRARCPAPGEPDGGRACSGTGAYGPRGSRES